MFTAAKLSSAIATECWLVISSLQVPAEEREKRRSLAFTMDVRFQRGVKRGLLAAVGATALSWGIFHANVVGANVNASWTYDYGFQPSCSASRPMSCIDHFEVQDITNQQKMVPIQSVTNPISMTGRVDRISTSFKYGPPFGQRTFSVIAVGKDAKGDRVASNPFAARATVMIWPRAKLSLVF